MEDLLIRPGFNLHAAFRGHLSPVRRVTYNVRTRHFLSMDEHSLKAWTLDRDGGTRVLHDVQFPGHQPNFITSMVLSQELNLLFTACLDDNLRLYNERLRLKSCMPWSNGVVREMAFYEPRSLLVTAGSYGVKVWQCLLDYEAFRTDKTSDMYDVPKIKDGSVLPWCFGKYQHVRLRCSLHVPGARLIGAAGSAASSNNSTSVGVGVGGTDGVDGSAAGVAGGGSGEAAGLINAPWCDRIVLHEPTAMVLAMFQGNVYGFDIMNGTCLSSYTGLYTQPVTSCVFVPEYDLLFTTAMDTTAMLWRIPRGCDAQRFKQFGRSSAPMTVVVQDPDMKHVLTTALDGSVVLWDMDTLVPVFRMKLSRVPVSTAFYKPNAFFLATDTEVKLFTVTHLFEAWMDCNSPVVSLKNVSYGLILAEFADSSVRLLDAHESSHRPDKAVVTSMPQLSSQSLVAATVSLTAARLFTLLGDGAVHVWQLHLRRPPSLLAAWTHLSREVCVSLCYLDAGVLNPAAATRMALPYDHVTGFTHDHLALGTAAGDCLMVDITSGSISFRFPAFKHQPLHVLAADLDRSLLVTCSRNAIKIWTLQDVRCVHEMLTTRPISRVELLEGRAVIGTVSGSVHVMELSSGAANAASVTVDHLDAVTGLGPSVFLQHVVTGSKDSHIKVFDRDKRFKRSIYVGAPVAAVAYLNDRGDILAAMGTRLVVIRVDKYDMLPSAPKESIYDELRGQGRAPRTLLRAMQSRMQRLSRCKVPLQTYSAWLAEEDAAAAAAQGPNGAAGGGILGLGAASQALSRRRTPPLRRLRSVNNSDNASGFPLPGSAGSGGSGGGRSSLGRPPSQGSGAAAVKGAGGSPLAVAAAAPPGSASGSRPSSVPRGVLKAPVTQAEGDGQELRPSSREMSSRGRSRSVQWRQTQQGGDAAGEAAAEAAGASGAGGGPSPEAEAAPWSGPSSPPAATVLSPRPSPRLDPAAASLTTAGGGGAGGADARGNGDGDGSDQFKSEDEEEGLVIAREMYPLKFKVNLHKEKMRIDRLLHGLPSIHQRGAYRAAQAAAMAEQLSSRPRTGCRTPSRENEGAAAAASGGGGGGSPQQPPPGTGPGAAPAAGSTAASVLLTRLTTLTRGSDAGEQPDQSASEEESEASSSDDDDDGSKSSLSTSLSGSEAAAELPLSVAGLSCRFRRTLPVIASPSAFFDGHLPPEALPRPRKAAGAGGPGAGVKQRAGGKRASGDSAAATAGVTSPRPSADGGAGAAAAKAATMTTKKKRKKTRRRRRRAPGDADVVKELKARLDYEIRDEIKKYEKYQTVQRLAGSVFLPRLGGAAAAVAAAAASRASLTVPIMPGSHGNTDPGGTVGGAAAVGGGGGSARGLHTLGATSSGAAAVAAAQTAPPPQIGGPSFKTMLKGLGMRGTVTDMARLMQDPSRFVVAQEQETVAGQVPSPIPSHRTTHRNSQGQGGLAGAGGSGQLKPSGHRDERRVTMAPSPSPVGAKAGGGGGGGEEESLRSRGSGAVVPPGDYGFKAFMEAHDKKK